MHRDPVPRTSGVGSGHLCGHQTPPTCLSTRESDFHYLIIDALDRSQTKHRKRTIVQKRWLLPPRFFRIFSTKPLIWRYSSHSFPADGPPLLHSREIHLEQSQSFGIFKHKLNWVCWCFHSCFHFCSYSPLCSPDSSTAGCRQTDTQGRIVLYRTLQEFRDQDHHFLWGHWSGGCGTRLLNLHSTFLSHDGHLP